MNNKASKMSSNLFVGNKDGKIKLSLDDFELKNVLDYKISSSAKGKTELVVTMLVDFPPMPS
ncbi:hypothetical protein HNQ56_003730 [Anaerotaenia torta]|uniref:hypothetical protein n=1 Tax=Anaerotaenia torta TaxID=433293 RepID=UPI003D1F0B7F